MSQPPQKKIVVRFRNALTKKKEYRSKTFLRTQTWNDVLAAHKLKNIHQGEYCIQTLRKNISAELTEQIAVILHQLKNVKEITVQLIKKTRGPVSPNLGEAITTSSNPFTFRTRSESEITTSTLPIPDNRRLGTYEGDIDDNDDVSQFDDAFQSQNADQLKAEVLKRLEKVPAKDFLDMKQQWGLLESKFQRPVFKYSPKVFYIISEIVRG